MLVSHKWCVIYCYHRCHDNFYGAFGGEIFKLLHAIANTDVPLGSEAPEFVPGQKGSSDAAARAVGEAEDACNNDVLNTWGTAKQKFEHRAWLRGVSGISMAGCCH